MTQRSFPGGKPAAPPPTKGHASPTTPRLDKAAHHPAEPYHWPEPNDWPGAGPLAPVTCPACGARTHARRGVILKHRIRAPTTAPDPWAWRDPVTGERQSPLGPDGWCIATAP